jgi:hypothetical protein
MIPGVIVSESTRTSRNRRVTGNYVPPDGAVYITADGRNGLVHVGALQVTIDAAGEDAVLAAARALEPIP